MDSKALRLYVAAIVTTVVLVAVVVYAANKDRIDSLLGVSSDIESTENMAESGEESETQDTEYGEQIGDNLKGFLTADDFFDKSEQRPSVVVVVDNVPVPANASSEDGTTDLSDMTEKEKMELPEEPDPKAASENASEEISDDSAKGTTEARDSEEEMSSDSESEEAEIISESTN